MRGLKRTVWLLLFAGVLLYAGLAFVGIEPKDRRPGTRLSGNPQPIPADWAFTNAFDEVHLQTHPVHGIPFSVTTVLATKNNRLYVPSIYSEAAEFPGSKYWNTVVARNPSVKLRVGDSLYSLNATPVTAPQEFDQAFLALAEKYPFWANALADKTQRPFFAILRLEASDE